MPANALAIPDQDQNAPNKAERIRIPARVRHACDLLASGTVRTISAAAERVNLSREHLSRMLSKPHVQAFITREARKTIALGSLRASNRVLELIDAASEHVSLDAAKHVLAIEGIKPDERGTNININNNVAGYVINLAPGERVMSHQEQTEAKPLIDNKGEGNGT